MEACSNVLFEPNEWLLVNKLCTVYEQTLSLVGIKLASGSLIPEHFSAEVKSSGYYYLAY